MRNNFENTSRNFEKFNWEGYEELYTRLYLSDTEQRSQILASFGRSTKMITEFKHLIGSICFYPAPLYTWDFNKLSQNLCNFELNSINIWNIKKGYEGDPILDKIERSSDTPCEINFITINPNTLPSSVIFNEIYLGNDKYRHLDNYLYFNGLTWFEVINIFRSNNLIISGGGVTKRHILSATKHCLSLLIICHEGARLNSVISSFYLKDLKFKHQFPLSLLQGIESDKERKSLDSSNSEISLILNTTKPNFDFTQGVRYSPYIPIKNLYDRQQHQKEVDFNHKTYGAKISNDELNSIKEKLYKEFIYQNKLNEEKSSLLTSDSTNSTPESSPLFNGDSDLDELKKK